MVSPRSFPKNAHSGATMILHCAPPSCHLMCKLCVSWAVRGNPSVSGRTVCTDRVPAYAFHHFGSTVLVLTLQYICTIYSVAVSILHRTQLLGVTPHGLKRAVLSSRGLVCVCNRRSCQTMDSVRAPWPVRFKCNPPSSLCNTHPMTHHCSSSCTLSVHHTSY